MGDDIRYSALAKHLFDLGDHINLLVFGPQQWPDDPVVEGLVITRAKANPELFQALGMEWPDDCALFFRREIYCLV